VVVVVVVVVVVDDVLVGATDVVVVVDDDVGVPVGATVVLVGVIVATVVVVLDVAGVTAVGFVELVVVMRRTIEVVVVEGATLVVATTIELVVVLSIVDSAEITRCGTNAGMFTATIRPSAVVALNKTVCSPGSRSSGISICAVKKPLSLIRILSNRRGVEKIHTSASVAPWNIAPLRRTEDPSESNSLPSGVSVIAFPSLSTMSTWPERSVLLHSMRKLLSSLPTSTMVASARSGGVVSEGDVQAERVKRKVRVRKKAIAETGLSKWLMPKRVEADIRQVYKISKKSTNSVSDVQLLLLVLFSPHQPK